MIFVAISAPADRAQGELSAAETTNPWIKWVAQDLPDICFQALVGTDSAKLGDSGDDIGEAHHLDWLKHGVDVGPHRPGTWVAHFPSSIFLDSEVVGCRRSWRRRCRHNHSLLAFSSKERFLFFAKHEEALQNSYRGSDLRSREAREYAQVDRLLHLVLVVVGWSGHIHAQR